MPGLHDGPAIANTVSRYVFFGYCLLATVAIPALRRLVSGD